MGNIPEIYWRFVLCAFKPGSYCTPLSSISRVATAKTLQYPLCRPAVFTCNVPSESPHVNLIAEVDGFPFLDVGNRVIKGYRRASNENTWTIEYCGIVWNLEDSADGNTCQTQITAYDPMQWLTKRLIRDSSGNFAPLDVLFSSVSADQIAKQMVDRTNLIGATGINTSLGTFTTASVQSAQYAQQYVATGLVDMCDTGYLDVWFDPIDSLDGDLVAMSAAPMRTGPHSGTRTLSYCAPGHSAFSMDRVVSLDTMANSIDVWGGSVTPTAPHENNASLLASSNDSYQDIAEAAASSQSTYGVYEDASVLSDVTADVLVQGLLAEQLAMRSTPRDLLTLLPVPEKAPRPFSDFFLGDLIQVAASYGFDQEFPQTREQLLGTQRVYGITIDIDDEGVERVSGVDFSPQTGSIT